SGSFDWYQRTSSNLLLNVPTMWSTGFGSLLDNAGEVRSRGWDLEITSRNIQRDNFTWSTSFNLSHNTNKVTQLIGDQQEIRSEERRVGKECRQRWQAFHEKIGNERTTTCEALTMQ